MKKKLKTRKLIVSISYEQTSLKEEILRENLLWTHSKWLEVVTDPMEQTPLLLRNIEKNTDTMQMNCWTQSLVFKMYFNRTANVSPKYEEDVQ